MNGMPELHRLTPSLTVLQNKGFKVALVTDGRMSGASGAVPAAIHVKPAADADSPLARIQTGDAVTLDAATGELEIHVDAAELNNRPRAATPPEAHGYGRELFNVFRAAAGDPEAGASVFGFSE